MRRWNARERRSARRFDVTFPTALLDLGPVVGGFDACLAWLARVNCLRAMSDPLARWSRRLVIHVHEIHSQTLAPEGPQEGNGGAVIEAVSELAFGYFSRLSGVTEYGTRVPLDVKQRLDPSD